jgi:hypothetical protein
MASCRGRRIFFVIKFREVETEAQQKPECGGGQGVGRSDGPTAAKGRYDSRDPSPSLRLVDGETGAEDYLVLGSWGFAMRQSHIPTPQKT